MLINGTPSGIFRSSRGLRKGDPLSPYLFVTVMQPFSQLLEKAARGGFLKACHVGRRRGKGMEISHLLFVGDMLVFCEASQDQLTYLYWLLMRFEALSRLKTNLEKSKLIPIGTVTNADFLAKELGCKVGNLPPSYLGMPLGARFNSENVWDRFEEQFKKRLALWKRQYISKGRRITLIRSTLLSLPIYLMSILPLPRKVRLRFD